MFLLVLSGVIPGKYAWIGGTNEGETRAKYHWLSDNSTVSNASMAPGEPRANSAGWALVVYFAGSTGKKMGDAPGWYNKAGVLCEGTFLAFILLSERSISVVFLFFLFAPFRPFCFHLLSYDKLRISIKQSRISASLLRKSMIKKRGIRSPAVFPTYIGN